MGLRAWTRPFDAEGLDRPRRDWGAAPRLHLLMSLEGRLGELTATLRSLRAQVHEHWSLHAIVGENNEPRSFDAFSRRNGKGSAPFSRCSSDFTRQNFADDDRIAVIQPGDVMPPYALATVAETLLERSHLDCALFRRRYSWTRRHAQAPILKPDWSPIFYDAIPYVGRLTFLRHGDLARHWPKPC